MSHQAEDATPAPSGAGSECQLIRGAATARGKQDLDYAVGVSAETVGSRGLHMQLVTIPPGARAHAHRHVGHETAIYALSGTSAVWHGDALQHHTVVRPGDFLFIPAGVPHLPYNQSATEPAVAVIARTDPNEQESVELLPDLPVPATLRNTRPPPTGRTGGA